MIGCAVGSGLTVLWILIAFAVIPGTIVIRMEARQLEVCFGEPYREVHKAVSAPIAR